jgi:hypothetical protein
MPPCERVRIRYLERVARLVTTALILGVSIGLTLTFAGVGEALGLVPSSPTHDWEAYWNAAARLVAGDPLFPPVEDPGAADVYRYPPWFALMWVPLTLLPREIAGVLWVTGMFLAALICVAPLVRTRQTPAVLLAALFTPFLAQAAIQGNVQPLLVALLARGLDRRWGPLAIGVAASLKAFPLVYAAVYLLRGQPRAAIVSAGIAALLVAPIALVDLSHYPFSPGPLTSLWLISPIAWAAGALMGLAALTYVARRPVGWFAGSVAAVLASPRLLYYDMTLLLVTGRELLAPPSRDKVIGRHVGR